VTRITGTLLKDEFIFIIIPRSVLIIMRNFADKTYRENKNTHFKFNNVFENPAIYKIRLKSFVEPYRPI
jgi:hypothetical protein